MSKNSSKKAFNIAFCGIITAIAIISMFASLIPAMTYALPAIAGLIIWTASMQVNRKWCILCYIAVSILSFVLVPEIEANMYLVLFFGYYPIVRDLLDVIKNKLLRFLVKIGIFNAAVIIGFNILSLILPFEQLISGMEDFGEYAVLVLWLAANVAFFFYDMCLDSIHYAYDRWLKPKINRLSK